jgi:hypothetical protein
MTATTFIGHFLGPNVHASRPAAAGLPDGTMYVCTTHSKIERVVSGAWVDYATLGSTYAGVASDTIFDAKGDLVAASGADAAAKLTVGSNGQVLTADSAQTLGIKWAAAAGGMVADTIWDAKGDLAVGSAADTGGRLAVGSNGQVLTADSTQTLGVKWAAAGGGGGSSKLFDSTLGADAATIDSGASGIAAGYAALDIHIYLRAGTGNTNNYAYVRVNNDSTYGNYAYQYIRGVDSSAGANRLDNDSFEVSCVSSSGPSGLYAAVRMAIPNYAGTVGHKSACWQDGYDGGAGASQSYARQGRWKNTAAISRISVTGAGGNLAAGSRLTVFGLN